MIFIIVLKLTVILTYLRMSKLWTSHKVSKMVHHSNIYYIMQTPYRGGSVRGLCIFMQSGKFYNLNLNINYNILSELSQRLITKACCVLNSIMFSLPKKSTIAFFAPTVLLEPKSSQIRTPSGSNLSQKYSIDCFVGA